MESLLLPCSPATTFSSRPSFFAKPPRFSSARTRRFEVSCSGARNGRRDQKDSPPSEGKFDRRDMLLGIGGLYGATNLVSAGSPAMAEPIPPPVMDKCTTGTDLNLSQPLDFDCCPPKPSPDAVVYKIPPFTKLRVRPAAHLVSPEYLAKYEKAVALMKALPADDPRSYIQQANVHCAYCNLTYEQTKGSNLKLQIHNCWHFFPWHRWYLYFYERILGKLIGDPTFALPFWNWDNPPGMVMPAFFTNKNSSLYNENRDTNHYPPTTADLLYFGTESTDPPATIISKNLAEMYKEMISNAKSLEDFYGSKYVVGTEPNPGPGTIERASHASLHMWVGQRTREVFDMGNFATAGRESIFYTHHTNIDRLWSLWRNIRASSKKPADFTETDWLDSQYLFYDENAQLVQVNVADSLDNEKMGYTYQKVDNPWLQNRPKAKVKKSKAATTSKAPKVTESIFPAKLDKVVKVLVDRPTKKKRSKKEKDEEEELLVIEGIEVDAAKFVRFEVFVNDEDDKPEELIAKSEYAGCFSQVPQRHSTKVKSKIRLGLTELLEDLEAENDDKILVSVVPKAGGEEVTIGGIKIVFAS